MTNSEERQCEPAAWAPLLPCNEGKAVGAAALRLRTKVEQRVSAV